MSKITVCILLVTVCAIVCYGDTMAPKKTTPDPKLIMTLDHLLKHVRERAGVVSQVIQALKMFTQKRTNYYVRVNKRITQIDKYQKTLNQRLRNLVAAQNKLRRNLNAHLNMYKPVCTRGWRVHGRDCFRFFNFLRAKGSSQDAEKFCKIQKAHLASVKNKDQNNFISRLASKGINFIFIGLTDEKEEKKFVWRNGKKYIYRNWSRGEPNNSGDEDCVNIIKNNPNKQWNDIRCDVKLAKAQAGFVCEKPAKTVWRP